MEAKSPPLASTTNTADTDSKPAAVPADSTTVAHVTPKKKLQAPRTFEELVVLRIMQKTGCKPGAKRLKAIKSWGHCPPSRNATRWYQARHAGAFPNPSTPSSFNMVDHYWLILFTSTHEKPDRDKYDWTQQRDVWKPAPKDRVYTAAG